MLIASFLAIGSAVLHAAWNLSVNTSDDRSLALLGQFAAGGALALIGLAVVGLPGGAAVPYLVGSALVHVVYATGLARAYETGDFSLTYPLARAGGAVMAAVGGVAVLGDHVTAWAWVAIAVVALGVWSSIGPEPSRSALAWSALTATTIASYTLLDSQGARVSRDGAAYGFSIMVATSLSVCGTGMLRGRGRELVGTLRTSGPRHLAGGACATAAYALVLIAVRHAPVAQVAVLRESSVVLGALAGWLILKERLGRRRVAASCVMATGLVALVLVGTACSGDRTTDAAASADASPSTTLGPELLVSKSAFYRAPDPVPDLEHGTLLRYQPASKGYPGGGTTYRVMYVSRSLSDRPIVVTGTVHLPAGSAPEGGWPTITWGHGTTGVADSCAVSSRLDYASAAEGMVDQGYVIASTDYEGLGTPGLHPYLVGESEGRGMLDIVRAAAQLPGVELNGRFAVWGHSQGGHAAAFAHELAASWTPELTLVGTVAIAPPAQMSAIIPAVASVRPKLIAVMAIAGMAAAHPDLDITAVLTPEAIAALGALETGCNEAISGVYDDINPLLAPGALDSPLLQRYLQENEPGTRTATAPALIVQGDADAVVPPTLNESMKRTWCAAGQQTTRWVVPGAGHGTVLVAVPQMTAWTLARFAGDPAPDGCGAPDGPPPST